MPDSLSRFVKFLITIVLAIVCLGLASMTQETAVRMAYFTLAGVTAGAGVKQL